MSASVTSSSETVRPLLSIANSAHPPPLQLRLAYTAPYTSAAGDFRRFTIFSSKPTVVSSLAHSTVSVAVSSATRSQNSTSGSCSQVSSGISTSCSMSWTNTNVINVDEDSCSELADSGTSDDTTEMADNGTSDDTTVVSSTVESCTIASRMEVVDSSSTVSRSNPVSWQTARLVFSQSNNHFQPLHAGVECLQHIFQYLDISARLRAAQVCRCWRRMALQQQLVSSVVFVSVFVVSLQL